MHIMFTTMHNNNIVITIIIIYMPIAIEWTRDYEQVPFESM